MAPMQIKIRNAIGALKDQTSISLAKVASTGIPDLDVAIVKATSHEEVPMEEKYVQEVLHLTSYSRAHVSACVSGIGRRLSKTHTWIVALKSLMLAHRLLRDGDPSFEAELRLSARSRGMRILNVSDFRDESESNGWDYSAFIHAYGRYLDERLDSCSIGGLLAASKPRPEQRRSYSASSKHYEYSDSSYYNDGYLSKDPEEQRRREPKAKAVKDMKMDELMESFVVFQRLIDRILACRPSGMAKVNRLVNIALYLVVRESFLLYMDIRDGLAIMQDAFFDMEPRECSRAFDIYTKAAKQIDDLITFYSFCKALGVCRTTEYPVVEKVSDETLEMLDDFLRNRTVSARRPRSPLPQSPQNDREQEDDESYEINGMKALPAPPLPAAVQESSSSSSTSMARDPQHQNQYALNKKSENLIDIHEPPISSEEHENKLALALFSGSAETKVNTKWEAFSSVGGEENGDRNGNGRPTISTISSGTTGWEVALIEAESEISKPTVNTAPLAGGFNNLLLESLYEQAEMRQKTMAAVAPVGSASSVAMPGHAQSNFLALPAPPSAATALSQDPFAASVSVPPPAYVQMSEMKYKQQLLVQEQQQWLQYQQMVHPQGAFAGMPKYPNNPFGASAFQQPNVYPVSYYGHNPFIR